MRLWFEGAASRRALCLYWYCRARLSGGVMYPKAEQRTLERLRWSKAAYYRNIALMRSEGLLSTDAFGNHRLMRSSEFIATGASKKKGRVVIPKHSSTLILEKSCTMKQVRSAIAAKLIERRIMQLTRRPSKREALKCADQRKRSSKPFYAESQGDGYAQLTTRQLVKHSGLSRSSLVRWKREARKWFSIRNERTVIPLLGRARDDTFRFTYIDSRGNGVLVHPTKMRTLAEYLPKRMRGAWRLHTTDHLTESEKTQYHPAAS